MVTAWRPCVRSWAGRPGSVTVSSSIQGSRSSFDSPAGLRKRLGEHRMHESMPRRTSLEEGVADGSTLSSRGAGNRPGAPWSHRTMFAASLGEHVERGVDRGRQRMPRRVDTSSGTGRDLGAAGGSGTARPRQLGRPSRPRSFGSAEVVDEARFKRRKGLHRRPVHVFSRTERAGEALGEGLDYTRGRGYLSLDVGYTQTGNALPEVEVRGVVASADGPRLAVVSVASDNSPEFFVSRVSEFGKDRRRIASSAVDSQLFLLEIPSDLPLEDNSAGLVVRADGEERTLGWSDRVMTARGPRPADSSERWRDDETSVDVLRHSMYGILVVGRRAFQKIRKAVARRHQA